MEVHRMPEAPAVTAPDLPRGPWFVDLFAGCGGFSKGLLDAGWRHVVANEIWEPAVRTYERNVSTNVVHGDIRDEAVFQRLVAATRGVTPLVVVGGPPCQGYSMAGNRNPVDPRGHLWKRFVAFVGATRPVAFVMENVRGLLSMKHIDDDLSPAVAARVKAAAGRIQRFKDLRRCGRQRDLTPEEREEYDALEPRQAEAKRTVKEHLVPLLPKIRRALTEAGPGYAVQYRVLNAAHYGVAQVRKRVFVVGVRRDVHAALVDAARAGAENATGEQRQNDDEETFESENGGGEGDDNRGGDEEAPPLALFPAPTHVPSAGDDPEIPDAFAGHVDPAALRPFATVAEAIGDLTDAPEDALPNHIFTRSKPTFVAKIARTAPGTTVYPNYSDAWYRLRADEPARTVKENHGGVHCHPVHPRTLTPRELARLQSFPDDFVFLSSKSHVLVQIGNAVPPRLARAIGETLQRTVFDHIFL